MRSRPFAHAHLRNPREITRVTKAITAKEGNQLEITEIRKSRTPRRPVSYPSEKSVLTCLHSMAVYTKSHCVHLVWKGAIRHDVMPASRVLFGTLALCALHYKMLLIVEVFVFCACAKKAPITLASLELWRYIALSVPRNIQHTLTHIYTLSLSHTHTHTLVSLFLSLTHNHLQVKFHSRRHYLEGPTCFLGPYSQWKSVCSKLLWNTELI